MKRAVKTKNLIAFTVVLIVLISITVTPCYAVNIPLSLRQRFAAGIASALLGLNITLESTLAPYQQMLDYVAGPLNTVIEYTYPQTNWEDEILDRSVIQIWDEYVTIDGVKYTDIWLSNEAAEKFRVNAFDFATGYNIASNTGATFAQGEGFLDGSPMYLVNGNYITQDYTLGYGTNYIGNSSVINYPDNRFDFRFSDGSGTTGEAFGRGPASVANKTAVATSGGNVTQFVMNAKRSNGEWASSPVVTGQSLLIDNTDFDFDYVAGTIPADQPLPSNTGMMIRVPSTDIEPFLQEHPTFQNNVPVELDFDLNPEVKIDIEDLFDILAPILADLDFGDIQFIENHETPAPVINNLLPDTYKQEILNPIHNDFIETQNTINNMGDNIVENIPKIDEICNNIDTAPYHDLDTGLDHLPSVFLPFITDLRSALGIWHYVTEWLGQISTTFAFVTGCLVGTSIMTPIYAAIAGFMCIKVYRRMTG